MSSLEDRLFAWQFGSFGIILTRRTILYFVMILTACMSIYVFILVEEAHIHDHPISYDITWDKYLASCGHEVFTKEPRLAKRNFNSRFFRRHVSWDGYVIRVNYNEDNPMSMAYHSASILVKMEEDDKPGAHAPDLGLTISEFNLDRLGDRLGDLHRGDHIRFNATMQSMGDHGHLHHMHVFDFKKIDGHRDVEAHGYSNGRYKLRIEPHDGKDHSHEEETEHSLHIMTTDKMKA